MITLQEYTKLRTTVRLLVALYQMQCKETDELERRIETLELLLAERGRLN